MWSSFTSLASRCVISLEQISACTTTQWSGQSDQSELKDTERHWRHTVRYIEQVLLLFYSNKLLLQIYNASSVSEEQVFTISSVKAVMHRSLNHPCFICWWWRETMRMCISDRSFGRCALLTCCLSVSDLIWLKATVQNLRINEHPLNASPCKMSSNNAD